MRYFCGISGGIALTLIILEIFFRFLPVNSGIRKENTDANQPYSRYVPGQQFVYSHGWAMENPTHGTTNREGFINSHDFDAKNGLLLIGDSFIEAIMLNYQDTVQGQLDLSLHGNVYAAASAKNRLPDTLELARQFNQIIMPRTIVIFVKTNELENFQIPEKNGFSGFHVIGNQISLVHLPYQESSSKQLFLNSALLRYVYYNLKFSKWLHDSMRFHSTSQHLLTVSKSEKSAILNYYFSELSKTLTKTHVIFLMDGDRDAIYHNSIDAKKREEHEDGVLFTEMAKNHGFDVVDMQPIFERHWNTYHERMDFLPIDGHWNPVAHRLAAEAILTQLNNQSSSNPIRKD